MNSRLIDPGDIVTLGQANLSGAPETADGEARERD